MLEEGVGDRDRLIEQTAGVVAQIEDEALQLVGRDVLEDLVDRIAQAVEGLFVELGDAEITDVAALKDKLDGTGVESALVRVQR